MKSINTLQSPPILQLVRQPGSPEWSTMIRDNCKHAAGQLEVAFYQLGGWLEQIAVVCDSFGVPVWRTWGYKSFAVYVEAELHQNSRRVERLRAIYRLMNTTLESLPATVKERLLAQGFSKMSAVAATLELEKVQAWLDWMEAEPRTVAEVQAKVQSELLRADRKKKSDVLKDQAAATLERMTPVATGEGDADSSSDSSLVELDFTQDTSDRKPSALDLVVGGYAEGSAEPTSFTPTASTGNQDAMPSRERLVNRKFSFDEDSLKLINQAIATLKSKVGAKTDEYALSLICLTYLQSISYDMKGVTLQQAMQQTLAQTERALGIRLVAIDPKKSTIIYGQTSLQQLSANLEQINRVVDHFGPRDEESEEGVEEL